MSLNFSNLINEVFYQENNKNFLLIEEEFDYKVKCTQVNNEKLIIIKPAKIKLYSKFIACNPPKDCDYILVNEQRKTIFFIELKNSTGTSQTKEVREQLISGKKWFDHLSFILGYETLFDDYSVFLIHSVCNARNSRKFDSTPVNSVFKINGMLNLINFYNITNSNHRMKFVDFDKCCPKHN